MTQEDKELLLKDLCERLPYQVYCNNGEENLTLVTIDFLNEKVYLFSESFLEFDISKIKPYLRPMSSMTFEERSERIGLLWELEGHIDEDVTYKYQDWLNAHHFDYRGLILKHLALEAPEGMYSHFGDMETIVTVEHKGNKL